MRQRWRKEEEGGGEKGKEREKERESERKGEERIFFVSETHHSCEKYYHCTCVYIKNRMYGYNNCKEYAQTYTKNQGKFDIDIRNYEEGRRFLDQTGICQCCTRCTTLVPFLLGIALTHIFCIGCQKRDPFCRNICRWNNFLNIERQK